MELEHEQEISIHCAIHLVWSFRFACHESITWTNSEPLRLLRPLLEKFLPRYLCGFSLPSGLCSNTILTERLSQMMKANHLPLKHHLPCLYCFILLHSTHRLLPSSLFTSLLLRAMCFQGLPPCLLQCSSSINI